MASLIILIKLAMNLLMIIRWYLKWVYQEQTSDMVRWHQFLFNRLVLCWNPIRKLNKLFCATLHKVGLPWHSFMMNSLLNTFSSIIIYIKSWHTITTMLYQNEKESTFSFIYQNVHNILNFLFISSVINFASLFCLHK